LRDFAPPAGGAKVMQIYTTVGIQGTRKKTWIFKDKFFEAKHIYDDIQVQLAIHMLFKMEVGTQMQA